MTDAMRKATILLVEDSEDNRGIIRQLAEWIDAEVIEAENGFEGVRMAREAKPDVILMDLSLPMMSGWEAATVLKGDPQTAGIPIIALTAHAMAGDEARARAAGCDAYVSKPISLVPFQELLERYLGRDA